MNNFLFGNRLSSYSPFSPFGSTKNSKPGVITKIKNKIQGLFQPTINPSSTIQRIQCYNEYNLEKELSHQFKNNLVIVERIIPNNEEYQTSERKSLYPFDLYYKEVVQKQNEISKEGQSDEVISRKDQSTYLDKTKKQKNLKKNHAKNEKPRKMEAYQQENELDFNQKSKNLNVESNQEKNSSSFISNQKIKKKVCFKDCAQPSSPYEKQEGSNGQLYQNGQFEIESFAINKQNQQFDYQQLSDQKQKIFETQKGHSCNIVNSKQIIQENQYFSSSTGTNIKGETLEALTNMEHISFPQETDSQIQEEKYSNDSSLEIQNKLFAIFHPDGEKNDLDKKPELEQNIIRDEVQNNKSINQNQAALDTSEQQQQNKKQRNLRIESEIINLQIQCSRQSIIECKNEHQILKLEQLELQQQNFFSQSKEDSVNNNKHENIVISDKQGLKLENNQNILDINKDEISQQPFVEKKIQQGLFQKQLDEKFETPLSQNTLQSMNQENTSKTSKIIQENDQQKEFSIKSNQITKQNNPFLDTSSSISSDQVSEYFLQGILTGNTSFQQEQQKFRRNENSIDLFKFQTNNQLFNFNAPQQNQGYQTQSQNFWNPQNIAQKNNQCLSYKQMEIINQIPYSEQLKVFQQNNYPQPISNYYSPHIAQQFQCQPIAFQQSQSSNLLIPCQAPIQQQIILPQMQQSSYQISSINLFQSNSSLSNSNPNCCQEEGRMNHIYTKQDVLSFFQDTNKQQDQNLFVIDSVQSSNSQSNSQSQNQNISFTRGYERKQRINNN